MMSAEQYRTDVEQPIYGSMRRVRAMIICAEAMLIRTVLQLGNSLFLMIQDHK